MSKEERIVEFMRREGPVLPHKLAKFLGTDMIITGAHLSELSSKKVVLVTSMKVGGGSPVYYLPGQEEKLQRFYDELNGKDKATFDLLKEKKILRDKDLDALTRVSLRNIKDFAKPLEVSLNGEKEVFWKWYLVKNEEAGILIKEKLAPKKEEKAEEKIEGATEETKKEEIKVEPKPVETKSEQKDIKEKAEAGTKKETKTKEAEKRILEKQEILEKPEKKIDEKKDIKNDFLEQIRGFFEQKKIEIVEEEVLRKTEINFMVKMPTPVGEILYYVKAKSKKKCNDKDVSSAFLEGQMKKLPVLFLYSGEITKKAEEMLQQDIFKNLILLHLE